MDNLLTKDARVVILGAGPTGLGAAHRLMELGHENFDVYEATAHVGGLARSHVDRAGFTWDMGGHVQFSHYSYFDRLMDDLLGDGWISHERNASIWIAEGFVPYPLQQNLDALPEPLRQRCASGLESIDSTASRGPAANFREWILTRFGAGIADCFMLPYNAKVWAYPAVELSASWVGERVARPRPGAGGKGWGPNRRFRFPCRGGTGAVWRALAARLPEGRLHVSSPMASVTSSARIVRFADGTETEYDALISTVPLDLLVHSMAAPHRLDDAASKLVHSSVHVLGIGLHGQVPPRLQGRSWIYFPEDNCPFYRATVLSSYAPANVPDASRYWSLLLEVAESSHRPVRADTLEDAVLGGLVATGLVEERAQVATVWKTRLEHGYPTPTCGRDDALAVLLPELERANIFSRGRFGAWKYEVSNQDHSLMQGVEIVDRLLRGMPEVTVHDPARVNASGFRDRRRAGMGIAPTGRLTPGS